MNNVHRNLYHTNAGLEIEKEILSAMKTPRR